VTLFVHVYNVSFIHMQPRYVDFALRCKGKSCKLPWIDNRINNFMFTKYFVSLSLSLSNYHTVG
jgi:hypothetical protein